MIAPTPPRWPPGSWAQLVHALVLVVLLMVAVFVVMQGWLGPLVLGPDFESAGASPLFFALLGLAVLLQTVLVIGVGLVRLGRVSLSALGWREADVRGDIVWGLAGFLAVAGVVLALSAAMGSPVAATLAVWLHQTSEVRLAGLCIGLLAAFNEETLFRGYLQGGLVVRLGPVLGVVATAMVFALYHGNLRPVPLLGKFLLGVIFGALALRRHRLYPSALAHVLTWVVMGFT